MRIWIGTSGWQYDDWRGDFYPKDIPKRRWLPYFSERFPTVEVNNTFYRLPDEDTFVSWRKDSAEDFVLTVKASRFITHMKRLKESHDPVRLLWSRVQRLGRKLGIVLFQLPPNMSIDLERLAEVLGNVPKHMRPAFEFREASWHTDATYELLDEHGAALVLGDRPGVQVPDRVTGGWSYIRFHKGSEDGWGYKREKLRRWADRIGGLDAEEVWVYFNNDPGGAAVRDAYTLTELLTERTGHDVRGPVGGSPEA